MPIIPGPPGGPIPQSFCGPIPRALLMLPCTMKELFALWLRSAMFLVVSAPALPIAEALADSFTSRR
jgi:hypothetical protein